MRPYCKLVPTGSFFVMGLIVLVYDHSKRFPLDVTEAINNSNLKKKAELTYSWLVPIWVWSNEE